MKIAIGFFGFVRSIISKNDIINFLKLYENNNIEFDIYINCPNQLVEFAENPFDRSKMIKEFIDIFNIPNVNIIKINLFNYDPFTFINKSEECGFLYHLESINGFIGTFPFRQISLHYSISNVCKLILNENVQYDIVTLTRFDTIVYTKSLGECVHKIDKENIFIGKPHEWETYKYFVADDVIITSSIYGINVLSNLYDFIYEERKLNITSTPAVGYWGHCSEWLITRFLDNFQKLKKEVKIGEDRLLMNQLTSEVVTSNKNFVLKTYKLLKEYNKLYNRNYFEDKIEYKTEYELL
jgi:hypothetical protein